MITHPRTPIPANKLPAHIRPAIARVGWARRRLLTHIGAVAVALASCGAAVAQSFESQITSAISAAKLGPKAEVGVCIIDTSTGQVLAAVESKRPMTPASNLKLVTSGVALHVLGPDFEFKTSFFVDGGSLVIRGGGDPALGDPKLLAKRAWTIESFIAQIADAAAKAKVSGIEQVVVDDRVFDRFTVHPSWPEKQLNLWYCAPVLGLNFHTNVVELYPRASDRAGGSPIVVTQPAAPWIQVDTASARTSREGATSLWAQQSPSDSVFAFKLFGTFRTGNTAAGEPVEVTVDEPGLVFAKLVRDELERRGMTARASVPVRLAIASEQFNDARTFAVVSTPIQAVIERCNTDSQNLYAEALIKRVANQTTGQPGSWTNGVQVARAKLQELLGTDVDGLQLSDGSGLSRDNRISPATLARWLAVMVNDPRLAAPYWASMASTAEGRLQTRFRDRKLVNRVKAKTGYIRGVLCLSGYVSTPSATEGDAPGDRTIAFVVMVNNTQASLSNARELHEDIVQIVDRWLARQAPKPAPEPAFGG